MFGVDPGPLSDISLRDFGGAMLFSLAASIVTYGLYAIFYGDRHVGSGVHRMFLLGGPAITTLFIGIQFSLPLSLGLLGALSFVRFRTPVKDPAEIGFLLLLIAASIGAATYNYRLIMFLYLLGAAVLSVQRLVAWSFPGGRGASLLLVVHTQDYAAIEERLSAFLRAQLRGLRLESVSTADDRVSLHYRYRTGRRPPAWGAFQSDLNALVAPARAEVFVA